MVYIYFKAIYSIFIIKFNPVGTATPRRPCLSFNDRRSAWSVRDNRPYQPTTHHSQFRTGRDGDPSPSMFIIQRSAVSMVG